MTYRFNRHTVLKPVSALAVGAAAVAIFAVILLTDPLTSETLWPSDIHSRIVWLAGGNVVQDATGTSHVNLAWWSVFLRVLGLALIGCAFSAVISQKAGEASAVFNRRQQWRRGFAETARRLAICWSVTLVWSALWLAASIFPNSILNDLAYLTPNLWAALIAAATVCALWPEDAVWLTPVNSATDSAGRSDQRYEVIVWLMVLLWTAVSFRMNERLYAGLWIPHGDSAMYEEHLWNVWHGKGFRSYLDQGLFLGEHIQVIHLLLLPLHMLWPSHLLLELAESLALGICAVPIFRLARRYSGSSTAALWLAGAWLFYFPMHFLDIAIDLKTLRPGCFGLPFLFWGIDFAERHRLRAATFCFAIALSAQEDFALIIGPIGFVLWLIHRRDAGSTANPQTTETAEVVRSLRSRQSARWSLILCGFAIVYVLAAVLIVIPWFRSGMVVHYSRYFGELGDSPGDLVRTAIRQPLLVLSHLLSVRTLGYVLVFALPVGFLMFRSPLRLLAGAATFGMLSLIQLGDGPAVPYHHFHAPLLPVLFWAAAAGLSCPKGQHRSVRLAQFAFFCSLFAAVTTSMMPVGAAFWSTESRTGYTTLFVPGPRAAEFPNVLRQLPQNSRVASTDYVHTRLTHFDRSYDYSDYLRAVNHYRPGVPDDTEYIVIDTRHPYSTIRTPADVRELRESPEVWELLPDRTNGYFIILKRRQEAVEKGVWNFGGGGKPWQSPPTECSGHRFQYAARHFAQVQRIKEPSRNPHFATAQTPKLHCSEERQIGSGLFCPIRPHLIQTTTETECRFRRPGLPAVIVQQFR